MADPYDRFQALDEMAVGQEFRSPDCTVTEADCLLFTGLAGLKAPPRVADDHGRKRGQYGQRVAPGLLMAAFTAGMMEDMLGPFALAALDLSMLKFTQPIFHGDTIHCVITVTDKADTANADEGVLSIRAQQFNQHDEQVFELIGKFLMLKCRDRLSSP